MIRLMPSTPVPLASTTIAMCRLVAIGVRIDQDSARPRGVEPVEKALRVLKIAMDRRVSNHPPLILR